jgi:hypothetical protein|nr:MAG TPA: hypothetical protein [Caudoviricetes sp.]DAQ50092.1 MAG TPA: hypothetical protein [Caudoviricetes sp.]
MLNVLPRISGFFIASHLKVSYSVAVELASIAFVNGLKILSEVSTHPKEAGRKSPAISDGGLRIRRARLHDHIDLRIPKDGSTSDLVRDIVDMRDPLRLIRTTVSEYQRPRRSWWAVVPSDQYSFTNFL